MTKEKAITIIESHKAHWQRLLREKICDETEGRETIEAFDMAISALSEEDNTMEWEEVSEEYDEVYDIDGVHTYADKRRCNRCGLVHYFIEGNGIYNFCPNCGRRAVKHDR